MRNVSLLVLLSLINSISFAALEAPQTFTLDGRLYSDSAGTTPLNDPDVDLVFQILDSSQTCILYEETRTGFDASASSGFFSFQIGSNPGDARRSSGDNGLTMKQVYSNVAEGGLTGKLLSNLNPCAHAPTAGQQRYLRVTVSPSLGATRVLSPLMPIDSVPSAVVAEQAATAGSVGGFGPNDLLRVNTTAGYSLSQTNLETVFSSTNYPVLSALLAGTSTLYNRPAANGTTVLPTIAAPASPAAGQIWYNAGNVYYYDGATTRTISTGSSSSVAAGAGSAAAPSISFSADTDTGWFSPGADQLAAATGGSERVRIDANGYLGVGTTAPGARLTLGGNSSAPAWTASGIGLRQNSATYTDTSSSGVVGFNYVNALGIPTLAASSATTYTNASAFSLYPPVPGSNVTLTNSTGLTVNASTLTGVTNGYGLQVNAPTGATNNYAASFMGGNVGIGTANPASTLHAAGRIQAEGGFVTALSVTNTYSPSSSSVRWPYQGANLGSSISATNSSIGDNRGAFFHMDVRNTAGNTQSSYIGSVASTGAGVFSPTIVIGQQVTDATSYTERVRIDPSGRLGIGTTAPATLLEVAGSLRVADGGETCAAGTAGGIRYNGGNLQFCNGTAWATLGVAGTGITSLTGDVTGTGPGATATTIANDAVTFAKMQNIATGTVVGRLTAGSGDPEAVPMDTAVSNNSVVLRSGAGSFDGNQITANSLRVHNAGSYVSVNSPLGATYALTLPADDGTPNQVLQTDGSGVLTWVTGLLAGGTGLFADGTAAAPGIAFSSDTNTGLWRPGADELAISTAGSERLRVNSSGSVGIGTTAPGVSLDVAGGLRSTLNGGGTVTNLEVRNNHTGTIGPGAAMTFVTGSTDKAMVAGGVEGASTAGFLSLHTRRAGTMTEVMRLNSSGNVGIGTTNPTMAGLEVRTAVSNRGLFATGGSTNSGVALGGDANSAMIQGFLSGGGDTMILMQSNGAAAARVGIGYATPANVSTRLAVNGSIRVGDGGETCAAGTAGGIRYNGTNLQFCNGTAWTTLGTGSGIGDFLADGSVAMTGALRSIAGSASAPGMTFVGDTDSGVFAPTTDNVSVTTAGTERMRVDASGNVGIGTTTPAARLHVSGNVIGGTGTFSQIVTPSVLGGTSASQNLTLESTNNVTKGFVNIQPNGGNVGIGTTAPAALFEVSALNGSVQETVRFTNTSGAAGSGTNIAFGGASNVRMASIGNVVESTTTNSSLTFNTRVTSGNPTEKMRITSSGNVGIGTTAPGKALDVTGTVRSSEQIALPNGTAAIPAIFIDGASTTDWGMYVSGTSLAFSRNLTSFAWSMSGSSFGGNGGGGSATLQSGGGYSETFPAFTFNADANTGIFSPGLDTVGITTNGTEKVRVTSTGDIGIGTTAPGTKLQVAGIISPSADATYDLGTSGLRFKDIHASNGTIQTSDARLKTDIKDSDLGLDFINSLRPVSYYWKTGDKKLHYGVLAQETEEALTEAKKASGREREVANVIVTRDEKTDRYGVRYTELIAPIIKAIQELYSELTGQDRRIASLEEENKKLKEENNQIKNYLCQKDKSAAFCK